MGCARCKWDHTFVFLRLFAQHCQQVFNVCGNGVDLFFQCHANVQRYLVIAGAGGVQPLAGLAQAGGQLTFNKCMNIFRTWINRQLAAFNIR